MLILASMRGDDAIVEDLLLASADVAARSNVRVNMRVFFTRVNEAL
jgi:hypothetical protein